MGGVGLIKVCQQQLERVASKIQVVTKTENYQFADKRSTTVDRELAQYLKERGKLVDSILEDLLPPASTYPPIIYEAMRYIVFAGEKVKAYSLSGGNEALAKDYTPYCRWQVL